MLRDSPLQRENSTIDKTLVTARLMDGFWERWFAHGVEKTDLMNIRSSLTTKEHWISKWEELANEKFSEAAELQHKELNKEAEMKYCTAGLYYQLVQWLIPENSAEKLHWLHVSLTAFEKADQVSKIETKYERINMENHTCFGRVRIPSNPKGIVAILNPLDSTKEELFTYEMDFVNKGFITISFDGPGQGLTYTSQGLKATARRWEQFVDKIIDYSCTHLPRLPIHLFGTSSGAAWAIYGSCNPKVSKVVAVSPAFVNETFRLPDYFIERTHYVLEKEESHMLPSFEGLHYRNPILLVHGKKDVMISDQAIYNLYDKLPYGKYFLEYENEGHCCNNKLPEIRQYAMEWFEKG
jgi:predicted esterase